MNFSRKMTIIIAIIFDALFLISCNNDGDNIMAQTKYYGIAKSKNYIITISSLAVNDTEYHANIYDFNLNLIKRVGFGSTKPVAGSSYTYDHAVKFKMIGKIGFLVTYTRIYRTIDEGYTWENIYSNTGTAFQDMDYDSKTLIATRVEDIIISYNHGDSFSSIKSGNIGEGQYYRVGVFDDTILVVMNEMKDNILIGVVKVSHDKGASYKTVLEEVVLQNILMTSTCITAFSPGNIAYSIDNGNTWRFIKRNTNEYIAYYNTCAYMSAVFIYAFNRIMDINGNYVNRVFVTRTYDNWNTVETEILNNSYIDSITYDGERIFYNKSQIVDNSKPEYIYFPFLRIVGIIKSSIYCKNNNAIQFACFPKNTAISPLAFNDGDSKNMILVPNSHNLASPVQVKVDPASYYARTVLGVDNDGVLAIAKYPS